MPTYFEVLDDSYFTAAPAATALNTATGTINTGSYAYFPKQVVAFGARVTTAWGVKAATAAKWQLQLLASDDSTVTTKASLTFSQASAAIGDVLSCNLEANGLDFQVAPGQRLRATIGTLGVATGGSAIGAAVPMVAWKQVNLNRLSDQFSASTGTLPAWTEVTPGAS